MSDQLDPGCLAIIIKSVEGDAVGTIVQCIKTLGVHSLHGVVWEVRSKRTLVTEYGGVGHTVHVPATWLRKINPGELDDLLTTTDKLETTE